jgi:hypothetical protein
MNRSQDDEKSRWDQVMEHFDMLFTRVNDIGEIQQDMKKQLNDNSAKVDNCTAEQKFIAQQVRAKGQAVAQLTIRQFEEDDKYASDAPESMIFEEEENPFATAYAKNKGTGKSHFPKHYKHRTDPHRSETLPHHTLPKMQFPAFDGTHPKIWIDNCLNYISIYSIPEHLWV